MHNIQCIKKKYFFKNVLENGPHCMCVCEKTSISSLYPEHEHTRRHTHSLCFSPQDLHLYSQPLLADMWPVHYCSIKSCECVNGRHAVPQQICVSTSGSQINYIEHTHTRFLLNRSSFDTGTHARVDGLHFQRGLFVPLCVRRKKSY